MITLCILSAVHLEELKKRTPDLEIDAIQPFLASSDGGSEEEDDEDDEGEEEQEEV